MDYFAQFKIKADLDVYHGYFTCVLHIVHAVQLGFL